MRTKIFYLLGTLLCYGTCFGGCLYTRINATTGVSLARPLSAAAMRFYDLLLAPSSVK